jgi:hypothetical protein
MGVISEIPVKGGHDGRSQANHTPHDAAPRLLHPDCWRDGARRRGVYSDLVAAETEADDGPDWPGKLTGRHKQVVDAYAVNDGYPLGFVLNFLTPNKSATGVIILRHEAFPLALNHAMWAKYKIGEAEKIDDPETKAAAVKNPYFDPKPGVLRNDNSAIDKLLARGTSRGGVQRKVCSCGLSEVVPSAPEGVPFFIDQGCQHRRC